MRYLILILTLFLLSGCARDAPEQIIIYEGSAGITENIIWGASDDQYTIRSDREPAALYWTWNDDYTIVSVYIADLTELRVFAPLTNDMIWRYVEGDE